MSLLFPTKNILLKLINLFEKNKIYWILGGHTGLIIQGINLVNDNEIDICTSKDELTKIKQILKKYVQTPIKSINTTYFKSTMATYNIDGVTIEVMADPQKKFANGNWIGLPSENIHQIIFENKVVNTFTLESELIYYQQTSQEKPKNAAIASAIKLGH